MLGPIAHRATRTSLGAVVFVVVGSLVGCSPDEPDDGLPTPFVGSLVPNEVKVVVGRVVLFDAEAGVEFAADSYDATWGDTHGLHAYRLGTSTLAVVAPPGAAGTQESVSVVVGDTRFESTAVDVAPAPVVVDAAADVAGFFDAVRDQIATARAAIVDPSDPILAALDEASAKLDGAEIGLEGSSPEATSAMAAILAANPELVAGDTKGFFDDYEPALVHAWVKFGVSVIAVTAIGAEVFVASPFIAVALAAVCILRAVDVLDREVAILDRTVIQIDRVFERRLASPHFAVVRGQVARAELVERLRSLGPADRTSADPQLRSIVRVIDAFEVELPRAALAAGVLLPSPPDLDAITPTEIDAMLAGDCTVDVGSLPPHVTQVEAVPTSLGIDLVYERDDCGIDKTIVTFDVDVTCGLEHARITLDLKCSDVRAETVCATYARCASTYASPEDCLYDWDYFYSAISDDSAACLGRVDAYAACLGAITTCPASTDWWDDVDRPCDAEAHAMDEIFDMYLCGVME